MVPMNSKPTTKTLQISDACRKYSKNKLKLEHEGSKTMKKIMMTDNSSQGKPEANSTRICVRRTFYIQFECG